jgi:archaellum component FlaF (FlaF/FlaG flagellin family)
MDYLNYGDYRYFYFGKNMKTPVNSKNEELWQTILDKLCTEISTGTYVTYDQSNQITVQLHKNRASVTRNGKTTIHLDQISLLQAISYRVHYMDMRQSEPRQLYVPLGISPKRVWHTISHIYDYPFFGTLFCYTDETSGFMMHPAKYVQRRAGKLYTVSPIESDL